MREWASLTWMLGLAAAVWHSGAGRPPRLPWRCQRPTVVRRSPRVVVSCAGPTTRANLAGLSGAQRLTLGVRIDLNSSNEKDLSSLPGIGPTRARAIVSRRRAHGPFGAVEDLRAIAGIGPKTIGRLEPYVTFKPRVRKRALGSRIRRRRRGGP